MKIQLLFDSCASHPTFKTGWGLSFLIGEHILFDTGEDGDDLIHNLKTANIDISKIQKIIISHDHYDHTGGLRAILKENPNPTTVYVPFKTKDKLKSEIEHLKGKVIELNKFTEIEPDIFIPNPMPFTFEGCKLFEQILVARTPKGLIVITGCAHPGIVEITKAIKKQFPNDNIDIIMGGFHLYEVTNPEREKIAGQFKELNVPKVIPIHCSGEETQKIFQQCYDDNCIDIKIGDFLEI